MFIPLGLILFKIVTLKKRRLEIAVISDIHLGSYTCHAEELLTYLSSIQPKKLILNGDILETQALNNNYFPPAHLKIVKKIFAMASKGTEVFYITGNHDDNFRKLDPIPMGAVQISNKLSLKLDGKHMLFFHGDIFDLSFKYSHWLLKFGTLGFDLLLKFAKFKTKLLQKLGKDNKPFIFEENGDTKRDSFYTALFEKNVAKMAIDHHYDHIICGHSHEPKKEFVETKKGDCLYLNSGDWVKHMTALEYSFKRWKLYRYENDKLASFYMDEELKAMDMNEIIASITEKAEHKRDDPKND